MRILSWALCPWFEEHGIDLVHPEDLSGFRRLLPYGKVFAVVGAEAGYSLLLFGREIFRVRPGLLRPIPPPAFVFGQCVWVSEKAVQGTVLEIRWHHGKGLPFYHLQLDGTRDTRRYWSEELLPSSEMHDR